MYAIIGITGRVGRVAANLLLEKTACKGHFAQSRERRRMETKGAEIAIAEFPPI